MVEIKGDWEMKQFWLFGWVKAGTICNSWNNFIEKLREYLAYVSWLTVGFIFRKMKIFEIFRIILNGSFAINLFLPLINEFDFII